MRRKCNRLELPNGNYQSAPSAQFVVWLTIPQLAQVALCEPHVMAILVQNRPSDLIPQLERIESTIARSRLPHDPKAVNMNLIRQHAPIVHAPLDEWNACIKPA